MNCMLVSIDTSIFAFARLPSLGFHIFWRITQPENLVAHYGKMIMWASGLLLCWSPSLGRRTQDDPMDSNEGESRSSLLRWKRHHHGTCINQPLHEIRVNCRSSAYIVSARTWHRYGLGRHAADVAVHLYEDAGDARTGRDWGQQWTCMVLAFQRRDLDGFVDVLGKMDA